MGSAEDVYSLFLQATLSRRVVSRSLAITLWKKSAKIVEEANDTQPEIDATEKNWPEFLARINDSLNDLDLEFRGLRDEGNGREMFMIVNRKGDEVAQAATTFTPAEIAYFKAVVEQIMLAPREAFSVSSTAALREVSMIKPKINMTKLQAESVLDSFVGHSWLLRSKRGRYSLASRAILELESYLKTNYPDELIYCSICNEIITKGYACPNDGCKARVHSQCYKSIRSKCPTCPTEWPRSPDNGGLAPVGEDAIRDGEDFMRRVRQRSETGDDSGEEEENKPQTQKKKTQKKKKKSVASSSDSEDD